MFDIAHIITSLINQGQSIYVILKNHPEIKLCTKTLYKYVEMGYFKDSLPREKLSEKRPYDVFKFMHSKRILDRSNIKEAKKDDVNITPSLLK